jgi:hypothetical protein
MQQFTAKYISTDPALQHPKELSTAAASTQMHLVVTEAPDDAYRASTSSAGLAS